MSEECVKEKNKSLEDSTNKPNSLEELIDSDTKKNKNKIKCLRCDSYILQPMTGVYSKQEPSISIPLVKQKKELANNLDKMEKESIENFWLVQEMMTFENIGFTNTVDNKKYLICADCEIGPIGLQSLQKPNEFLLCIDRVKHV